MCYFSKLILYCFLLASFSSSLFAKDNPLKILHVMSYHKTWSWNMNQFQGFKDGIENTNIEYKVVELDTKRDSNINSIKEKVAKAKNIIETWKPDLLYTNDDNAQKYLAQNYVGTSLPIVFSAVNRDPSEYNFIGAKNVTGVMEYEHFVPTLNLLHSLKKDIKNIAVIVDIDPTWKGVMSRMRNNIKHVPGMNISQWVLVKTFDEYKKKINDLQDKVDAIALLGIFNLKGKDNKDVNYESVLKWTVENSKIPDFAFWESRVDRGTLCAVSVSGYEQGFLAGKMAKKILFEGTSPNLIEISSTNKGEKMINLKRAKALDLNIDVQILLNSNVKKDYK